MELYKRSSARHCAKTFGGLKHQKPSRPVGMVAYNVFHNPHIAILDSIYPEIGLGVYQGEIVIIREGVTLRGFQHRWVIHRLDDHPQNELVQALLHTACKVVSNMLTERDYKFVMTDFEKSHEGKSEILSQKSSLGKRRLCSFLTCDDICKYPKEDVVYQVIQKCPQLQYYFKDFIKSTIMEKNQSA